MKRILFVTRHAHRDTAHRYLDNGLSERGRIQAKALADYLTRHTKSIEPEVLSSPKLRCQETLAPFCEMHKLALDIDARLEEQRRDESHIDLEQRVREFISWWKNEGPACLVISSHGDWIPEFFRMLIERDAALDKGGVAEIHLINKKLELIDLCQKP